MSAEFPTTEWIWRDGELIPWDDAQLHVMSHVVHYGSSIFEGIRSYGTSTGAAVFRLRDHLTRFVDSCKVYRMGLAYDVEQLREAVHGTLQRNELEECYVRPVAFRGVGAAGLHPGKSPVHLHIIIWPWEALLGAHAIGEGVDVCISSWARPAPNTFPALVKAGGNYLNSQLMKMEAAANGYDEAIGLSPDGLLSEASGQNVFLVREGALLTPEVDGSMLPGLTRDCVMKIAADLGIPVHEGPVPRERLYMSDEVFLVGTASEVAPVRSVDRIPVGDGTVGPIARQIHERYLAIARGEYPDVHGWLDRASALVAETVG